MSLGVRRGSSGFLLRNLNHVNYYSQELRSSTEIMVTQLKLLNSNPLPREVASLRQSKERITQGLGLKVTGCGTFTSPKQQPHKSLNTMFAAWRISSLPATPFHQQRKENGSQKNPYRILRRAPECIPSVSRDPTF